jgi:hypothetical protein
MNPEIGAIAVDAAFEEIGIPGCDYTPPAGSALSDITVIMLRPDDEARFGDGRLRVETVAIDVRASEVAAPIKGGVFTVDGAAYTVIAKPERRDSARLIWRCEVEPA